MKEKELLKRIGQRIKQLRVERNMSQQQLAAAINYEKSNMSRLESGGNPTLLTLYKIATALGVSLSKLVDVEE